MLIAAGHTSKVFKNKESGDRNAANNRFAARLADE